MQQSISLMASKLRQAGKNQGIALTIVCVPFLSYVLLLAVFPDTPIWASILVSLPLVVLSHRVWHQLAKVDTAAVHSTDDSSTGDDAEEIKRLNQKIIPIWNRQIDCVRMDSEKSVADLAMQFGGISARLNQTIRASVEFSNEGVSQIQNGESQRSDMISQAELAEILDTLREAIDIKHILLEKIQSLKDQTQAMKQVVVSVKGIAKKTNVLALNASIESARAGEHGKSFAVVAREVRKLSELSGSTVDDVVDKINVLSERMDEVIQQTAKDTSKVEQKEGDSSSNSTTVYERFKHLALSLSKSSEVLLSESRNIKTEIDGILVDLQYQDRTSQMLLHVTDNMKALIAELENTGQVGDAELWLNKLKDSYTMIEEVNNHGGNATLEPAPEAPSTMFFF